MTSTPHSARHEYRRVRERFFNQHGHQWPGTLTDAFDILAPCALTPAEVDDILAAGASLAEIFRRGAAILRALTDDVLLEMGVPAHVLSVVRCSVSDISDCVIGRFDLARTPLGYKLLELNADVPGLIVESFSLNAAVCRDAGKADPNASCETRLSAALLDAVRTSAQHSTSALPNVAVTFGGECVRDRALATYICGLLAGSSARSWPIESLAIDQDGLYDPDGNVIDVLYRIFPLHFLRNELFRSRGATIEPAMGGELLRLVERGKLALINPPFSFLLENKALQAVIWNLYEADQYFDERERALIEQHMLPTYLHRPPGADSYVAKPAYGAEGDAVIVVPHDSQAASDERDDQLTVYQRFVPLPAPLLMTEYGERRLHVVTSCFLIAGVPAGVCMRAGEPITDGLAWVLPVCLDGD